MLEKEILMFLEAERFFSQNQVHLHLKASLVSFTKCMWLNIFTEITWEHILSNQINQKRFLRLPHWFIFTLVLAGNVSAAQSPSIPKSLSPTPSLPCTHPVLPVPGVAETFRGQGSHRKFNQKPIVYNLWGRSDYWKESGNSHLLQQDLYNASIDMLPQFVWDMQNATGKATQISSMTTQTLEWCIFFFLCSTQRAKGIFCAEAVDRSCMVVGFLLVLVL